MATAKENIKELRQLIKIELQDCDAKKWPFVCEMQSTEKGYARIEEMIIRYVAKEAMPIGSAIALIEQEMTHIEGRMSEMIKIAPIQNKKSK